MGKILRRYRIIFGTLVIAIFLLLVLNLHLRVKLDRFVFINQNLLNENDEFKQAMENRFAKLKDDLLDRDIVLDNIFIDGEYGVKFDIHKNMYSDQIVDLVNFLDSISYLKIIEMNILKNDFDYNIQISAEI